MVEQTQQVKVAHLLRRFGLGASEAELEFYGAKGLEAAIDKLLDYESTDEGFDIDVSTFANPDNGQIPIPALQVWWYLRLLATRRPFEQKMTIFWHDHFATSAAKVDVSPTMLRHIEVLRKNATGPFGTLLSEVSKDPAMLYWLDNNENIKDTPNENFAREVMELFTLGVDNKYTERDIAEAARAFTGWTFGVARGRRSVPTVKPGPRANFIVMADRHDAGLKTVLGQTGNLDGDDVITILQGDRETAKHITKKIWEWFVYHDPDPVLIAGLATAWQKQGMVVKGLVRKIASMDEFYSPRAMRRQIKNPIDFCVSASRSLGIGESIVQRMKASEADNKRRIAAVAGQLRQKTKAMGMELMFPPDVAGWPTGPEWISTATMVERIKFADLLFGPQSRALVQLITRNLQGDDGKTVVDKLVSVFDAPLPAEKMKTLYEAARLASGGRITQQNAQPTMLAVSRLIFGSPEFQFC